MATSRIIKPNRNIPTVEEHENLLIAVSDFLFSKNIPHMPCFGTLLGLYRDGGIIEGDTDVDLLIFEENEASMLWSIHCLPDKLIVYRVLDPHLLSLALVGSDAYCDLYIFRHGPMHGSYSCADGYYKILPHEIGTPKKLQWRDRQFYTFENIEAYLTRLYGDWKTPSEQHASS